MPAEMGLRLSADMTHTGKWQVGCGDQLTLAGEIGKGIFSYRYCVFRLQVIHNGDVRFGKLNGLDMDNVTDKDHRLSLATDSKKRAARRMSRMDCRLYP